MPPDFRLSEWARDHFRLSTEDSGEPGKFEPIHFQEEILDSMGDHETEEVDCIKGAQIGWTTMLKIKQAFFIVVRRWNQLCINPTIDMAMTYAKDRFAPMVRDVEILRALQTSGKSRDSNNTILHKNFQGIHITFAGANSPASLASRPVPCVDFDEPDRYPLSAGEEGDPTSLGIKRTARFPNRKIVFGGTPTIEGRSVTQLREAQSDQRRWFVPCPECGARQIQRWGERGVPGGVQWEPGRPGTARYQCSGCAALWTDSERWDVNALGVWHPTNPAGKPGRRGYHAWEVMYPGSSLEEIVDGFLEQKKTPEKLQVWVNTTLGECWKRQVSDEIDANPLKARRRDYYQGQDLPEGPVLLTGSVDVQKDRLEVLIRGWGRGEECWGLEHFVILGDPTSPAPWEALDTHRARVWRTSHGIRIQVARWFVDSGNWTEHVYRYVEARRMESVMAVKGRGGQGEPLTMPGRAKGHPKVPLVILGTDTAKDILNRRLSIQEPGPGYYHFPTTFSDRYIEQLGSEVRDARGRWSPKAQGVLTEGLDLELYAHGALNSLNTDLDSLADRFDARPKDRKSIARPQAQGIRIISKGVGHGG